MGIAKVMPWTLLEKCRFQGGFWSQPETCLVKFDLVGCAMRRMLLFGFKVCGVGEGVWAGKGYLNQHKVEDSQGLRKRC